MHPGESGRNGEGSTREGVNGRAAGHPGSENPEKYVIVSSTVITKNRTNERRNERLNVARVGVHAFPPPPSSRSHHPFLPLEWIPASPFLFCLPPPVPPPSPPAPVPGSLFFPSSHSLHLRISAADAVIVRCSSRCIVARNNDFIKIHARGHR